MRKKPLRLPLRLCGFARVILSLALLLSTAVAARVERLIDTWRPTHYLVNISLDDKLSEISSASTRVYVKILKPTRVIDLDFGEMTVDRVTLDSKPVKFTHANGKLLVDLLSPGRVGDSGVLTIDYHGKPKDGLILTKDKDGKPSAVGDNWPNRVHHWIPVLDHPSAKATVTFNITATAGQEVVANGRLDHVENSGGQRTWTFSEGAPIPPYCMIIAVGQFAHEVPIQSSITPLSFYVPQSEKQLALKGFSQTNATLEFFTKTIAPYPYEKLAMIVGATSFGGMENSSAIVFTANLLSRQPQASGVSRTYGIPAANVGLIAHEVAHQWFGDSVTESTWSDLWLSEGFATYFGNLFVQRYEGEDVFQLYMKQAATNVFAFEKKKLTPIHDRETEDLMELLNAINYQKGAWVLHMLRSNLGDESFFRGIRDYYAAHKNSTASTEDLRRALEKASSKDLRTFFARWVYDSGHPQYELSWQWSPDKQLRLELRQLQTGNAFLDPVQVVISTATGKREVVLKPVSKQLIQTILSSEKPLSIEVDPRNVLLDEATVKGI
jgi:aminopeptidase N